jgi:DNA-binding LytR/AlgR family response regulator
MRDKSPREGIEALLEQLTASLTKAPAPEPLRWLHASIGNALRVIPVEEIDYLRSDEKYTLVAWRGDGGKPGEALIRTPLKDLVPQLDAAVFVQVHRSVVVNRRAISHVTRSINETGQIHLKGRDEVLPVSRSYLHQFRQM